jgi:hypothetical protein
MNKLWILPGIIWLPFEIIYIIIFERISRIGEQIIVKHGI